MLVVANKERQPQKTQKGTKRIIQPRMKHGLNTDEKKYFRK